MTAHVETNETAEHAAFRREVRSWLEANIPPKPDFILPQSFLEVETEQQYRFLQDWQRKVYDAGYIGYDVPEQYGGRGVDKVRQAIITQELGRAGAPFLLNVIGLQWAGPTILTCGTEAQKQRLLKPLLRGDEIWCQGFSEPEAGSDLASLQTRAEPTEGGYLITGHKVWTTAAHFASWMILLARTDRTVNKYQGISYFLFPMDTPGITIEPLVKITGEGGFNQVIFDNAKVSADMMVGRPGDGWRMAMTTLMFERGAAESSDRDRAEADRVRFLEVVALARKSRRDGHAAIDDAVLADELVQRWIEVEALRANARRSGVPGLCADRPTALTMMHKLLYTEFHQRLAKTACKLLGPELALWIDDPNAPDNAEWPRAYLNSYGFTIGGGTSEVQRNILGERVLGLPKSKDIRGKAQDSQ